MKKRLTTLIPYAIALAADFYAFPLLAKNTGLAMLMMLCVMPLITFICSLIWGAKHGFDLLLPIATTALFIPTILIYYNESAWVYAVGYGIISLVGTGVGRIFHRRR